MPKIRPCLWFDTQAEAAAKHYTSIFPSSKITATSHYTEGLPRPAGTVLTVTFELDGQPFMALNGGPEFKFSPAISLMVDVDNQAELDRINEALIAGGGSQGECGWVTDKFGLSWQVVPRILTGLITDPATSKPVLQAIMTMKKLDIAALKRAAQL